MHEPYRMSTAALLAAIAGCTGQMQAASGDTGSPTVDASPLPIDGGSPRADAHVAPADLGTPPVADAASPTPDASAESEPDAGRDDGVVLAVDFTGNPEGPYNRGAIEADFGRDGNELVATDPAAWRWPTDDDGDSIHSHIVIEEGDPILCTDLGDLGVHPNRSFMIRLSESLETAELRYRFRLDDSVDAPIRGAYKIPRLAGRRAGYGEYLHVDPDPDGPGGDPTTGFTTAMQFYGPAASYDDRGTPFTYVYHSDQPVENIGDQLFYSVSQRIHPGRWHEVALRVRVNTRGCTDDCDGVFVIEIDGEEIHRTSEWRLSDTDDLGVNRFFFLAQSNEDAQRVPRVCFDDFLVRRWEP
jgi:hypothetical protein